MPLQDQRKTPQNMFRPLLSSVPITTLYAGNPISAHEAMMSKNSSIATSSTASSDQALGLAPNMDGSGHAQHDVVPHYEDRPDTDAPEEVFVLDKMDARDSDAGTDMYGSSLRIQLGVLDEGFIKATEHDDDEDLSYLDSGTTLGGVSKVESSISDILEGNSPEHMALCSECGCKYFCMDNGWNDHNICPECSRIDSNLQVYGPDKSAVEISPGTALNQPDKNPRLIELEEYPSVSDYLNLTSKSEFRPFQCEDNNTISEPSYEVHSNSSIDNSFVTSLVVVGGKRHMSPQEVFHRSDGSGQPDIGDRDQLPQSSDTSSSYFNDSELDGISILLKRSSSTKGPIYQGRMFKASSIPYDDPFYARESGSFTRSSMGLGSTSASSSVDLGSGRQIETRIQRQSSCKKIEIESYRLKRTGSHSSETSNHAYQTSGQSINTHEDEFEACAGNEYSMEEGISSLREQIHTSGSSDIQDLAGSYSRTASLKDVSLEGDQRPVLMVATISEVPGCSLISAGSSLTSSDEKTSTYEHGEAIDKILLMTDGIVPSSGSQPEEEPPLRQTYSDAENTVDAHTLGSLHPATALEIKNELEQESNHNSEKDYGSAKLDVVSESYVPSVTSLSEKIETSSVQEAEPSNSAFGISESGVLIQDYRGSHVRSLTLEEATDTILFCRSVVQNLVDKATAIAIEKEKPPQSEPSHPILGKTNPQKIEPWGRAPSHKRAPKSHKPKKRRTQTEDTKLPPTKFENDENVEQSFPRNVGLPNKPDAARPPKLESKCNCTIM